MPYVYSTLANNNTYIDWKKTANDLHERGMQVTIKGGHGVANENIVTPLGVATEVTDEEAAFLEKNSAFQKHVENGYVRLEKKKADPEKVIADMNQVDKSAPLTPQSPEMQNTNPINTESIG